MYCILFLYQYNEDNKREKKEPDGRNKESIKGMVIRQRKARSAQNMEDRPMGAFEKGAVPL